MSRVREVGVEAVEEPGFGVPSGEPGVRWSARRKEQVVLRLLRGESLDLLARDEGQSAGRMPSGGRSSWLLHYEPETNGCAEKAIQILKEQLLWIERFETLGELRTAVRRVGRATTSTG